MTKVQLLAVLDAMYTRVMAPECIETVGDIKRYLYFALETGTGAKNGIPLAYKRQVAFYTVNEGAGGEVAYIEREELSNSVDNSYTAVNPSAATPLEVSKAYQSQALRQRVLGCLIKAAFDVYNEAPVTANHTKRMHWATDIFRDVNASLSIAMALISVSSSVLSGAPTDNDLQWLVNGSIDKWCLSMSV